MAPTSLPRRRGQASLFQPLTKLRVLEVGDFIAAPYAGKLLADLGAEVIKIEQPRRGDTSRDFGPFTSDRPDPDGSGLYGYVNANKLGVTLDLATHSGHDLFLRLAEQADVVLDGDPQRQLRRLSLGYPLLREVNPRLVMASVTAFGLTGPYADYRSNDLIALHASGTGHRQIGYPDREPIRAAWYQADHWGAINAAAGTMIALEAREYTGRGQHVDIASAEALAAMFVGYNNVGLWRDRGFIQGRTGHLWTNSYMGILPCKDGYVFIFPPDEHMWQGLIHAMGDPEWAAAPQFADRTQRTNHWQEILDLLLDWLKDQTKEEVFQKSQAYRSPNTAVYDMCEVFENGHLRERRFFAALQMPNGETYEAPGAPYRFSRDGWAMRSPAPRLGQHNAEVLCDRLGLSPSQLAALGRAGVA